MPDAAEKRLPTLFGIFSVLALVGELAFGAAYHFLAADVFDLGLD